jgi:hypothetical protein
VVRAASSAARKASCEPGSVAAVTPNSRETVSKVFSAEQPQHRCGLALPRHPATAAERRYARLLWSLHVARPRSNDVRLFVHGTPLVRKSSACEVSQSTVMRGTYDNAMAESFFSTLEADLLSCRRFASRAEAKMACFSYIEGWYNPVRLHSARH